MSTPDIQQFTIAQLEQLIEESKALLVIRIGERKAQAMTEAKAILADAGVSPRELARIAAERKPALALTQGHTYSNPDKPSEVWTAGKGRRPKWVGELEARGVRPVEVQ